ncbi:hypothetical protein Bca4012_009883 [Brassica carinata]|uniref:Uncharacterized protein n=1 Tax=Brassica carinata TaxID=52824 RepID=A0A8X7V1F1_BRACI|nr:hypothetical protein Bca52824_035109 [Brassica carinata]
MLPTLTLRPNISLTVTDDAVALPVLEPKPFPKGSRTRGDFGGVSEKVCAEFRCGHSDLGDSDLTGAKRGYTRRVTWSRYHPRHNLRNRFGLEIGNGFGGAVESKCRN